MLNHALVLKPSYLLTFFLLIIHIGAIVAMQGLGIAWYILLFFSGLIIISLVKNLRRYAWQLSPQAIIEIWPKENDSWLLKDKQGNIWQAELLPSSFRSLYLVVLNFRIKEAKIKKSVIILPDRIINDDFRQLRALLFLH